jgi:glycosyltransferase involved in cell wall biosynthesis
VSSPRDAAHAPAPADGVLGTVPQRMRVSARRLTSTRRPMVTVVVPCFNYGRYLTDCIRSVLDQEGVAVDVLLIDDASTDNSLEVASSLAAAHPEVRVIAHATNAGHVPTVNEGFAAAQGEYIVKLDADDLLTPGSLARSAALLDSYPSVGFVYGCPLHFKSAAPPPANLAVRSWTIWPGVEWLALRCRQGVNCISQPEVMIRAAALAAVGPVNANLPQTSDMELWLRLACMSDVGHIDGAVQGYYRIHDASMQRTVHKHPMTNLRGRRDAFASVFQGVGQDLRMSKGLQLAAERQLAAEALDAACRAYERGRVDDWPVDDFVRFALETYPSASNLREYHQLEQRRLVGVERAPRVPRFLMRTVTRRMREGLAHRRWLREGI